MVFLVVFFMSFYAFSNDLVLSPLILKKIYDPLLNKIQITNGKVISLKDNNHFLNIKGKKLGQSTLYLGKKKYNVSVLSHNNYLTYKKIKEKIKSLKGLKLKMIQDKIYLTGELLRPSDWIEISEIVQRNKGEIVFQAKTSKLLKRFFNTYFSSLASLKRMPDVRIDWNQRIPYVSLNESEKKRRKMWEKILSPYGIQIHFSPYEIISKKMIQVKMHIIEVNENLQNKLGLKMPRFTPSLLNLHQITDIFNYLKGSGKGKLVAKPQMILENDSKASFFVGGEIPIQSLRTKKMKSKWKKYGIQIDIKGKYNFKNKIQLHVKSKISRPDFSYRSYGNPMMKMKEFESIFYMKPKQTLLLYKLKQKTEDFFKKSIPFLDSIPVFSPFFENEVDKKQFNEFFILITPEIIG